ncbi:MAG: homoserine kinase [Bacteroidales bacterium]|nr:homoserine kinase [Candidatus Cacconaster merdequi]
MRKIRIFAPATIANMGCGFDVIGFALDEVGDIIEFSVEEGDSLTITNSSDVPLPDDVEKNVMTPVIRKFLEMTGNKAQVCVDIIQNIYPGSGIGASAAASAAAAVGMNELFGKPLDEEQLVVCAMEGENLASGGYHADNAAPAVMGGIVLIRGYEPLDLVKIPIPDNFYCTVIHPHIVVPTKEARAILPKEIPMHDAIVQWGNVGGLVAGLFKGDIGLVGRAMKDVVAEPWRKKFIPGFDSLRGKLLTGAGVLAMNISGSGPSVFALSDSRQKAAAASEIMKSHFAGLGIGAEAYTAKISGRGAGVCVQ